MHMKKVPLLFLWSIFVVCEGWAFVDTLQKCGINDNECMRDLYETIIRDIGKTGLPDLGIPPIDPIQLRNVTVSVLGLINITMVKGVALGVKDCVFDKFTININDERGFQENTCNITIKGHYILSGSSLLISKLLRGSLVHGDGNGKVRIEKLHLKFDFPFYAQKRDDGEIYIKCLYDAIKYDYEIQGKTKFFADNLYIRDQEVSKPIVELLNDNWRFVMSSFGKAFIDKAMEIYFTYAGDFFDAVPARYYILDDLSPYAKP